MYSPITLDALRVLDAIERRQSFAAAAEELFRVPSAISYTVSKLEEELEVQLFDRSRRRAELTPAGKLVVKQGRQILTATEELTALARQTAVGWEVELKIGIDSLLDYKPVYESVRAFQVEQPRIEIRLIEEVLGGTWDALSANRCDLAIGVTGEPPGPGLATHELGRVVFAFAVAPDHPLTQHSQPVPISAIKDYPTVVVADSSRAMPVRSFGLLDGRSRIVVPSIESKIQAQREGVGIGYLPVHRIQGEIEAGMLQVVELEETRPSQVVSLAWRSGRKGRALKWFITRLKAMRFDSRQGLIHGD